MEYGEEWEWNERREIRMRGGVQANRKDEQMSGKEDARGRETGETA